MNIYEKIGDIKDKQILLFQGPMGSFFDRLDREFQEKGANTFRVGLNAGDQFFSSYDNCTPFKGQKEEFEEFIEEYYKSYWIDMIFVFGDCRYYQSIAIELANKFNIKVFVFEEGYVRPNYVTLEESGVNANSLILRDRVYYDAVEVDKKIEIDIKNFGNTYMKMAYESSVYYIVSYIFKWSYPNYMHHRNFSPGKEVFYGIRSWVRKLKYRFLERDLELNYEGKLSKKYFFVPLQTHGDFQILKHSKYSTIEEFILEVLESFARYSHSDDHLVFKHHPVDRGRCDYRSFIRKHSKRLKVLERVEILYDVHLPTLLKHAKGTVVVNSTVGLSSLYHHTPTICLGDAIYDIEGLTSKDKTLDEFWISQDDVDEELFDKYRYWLIKNTQINGGFYKKR